MRDFFKPSELEPCLHAIEDLVDELAVRMYQANKIDGIYMCYHSHTSVALYHQTANHRITEELHCRIPGGSKGFIPPKLPKLDLTTDAEFVANLADVNVWL